MPGIPTQSSDVTALVLGWRSGDEAALGRIVPLLHEELRKIARRCLRGEHAAQSLQATALVNEASGDASLTPHRAGELAAGTRILDCVPILACFVGTTRRHSDREIASPGRIGRDSMVDDALPLLGPQGIFKPRVLREIQLSITTVAVVLLRSDFRQISTVPRRPANG